MDQNQIKKVLCFHGFGTNSDVLTFQLRQFKKEFKNFEFVTLDGPVKVNKKVFMDQRLARLIEDKNIYSWSTFSSMKDDDYYDGFEPGVSLGIKTLKEQGPFFAIMGFSQGSNVVAKLCDMIHNKAIVLGYDLKCLIYVSGVPVQGLNIYQSPLYTIPSMHFIGINDFLADKSITLSSQFLNPFVIYHNQGHKIPTLTYEQVKQIKKFFEQTEKQDWSKVVYIPKL